MYVDTHTYYLTNLLCSRGHLGFYGPITLELILADGANIPTSLLQSFLPLFWAY